MSYARQIKVLVSAEEEVLDKEEIRNVIMEMKNIDDEKEYNLMKRTGFVMQVDVFTSGARVKINNESYNDLIENCVYSTGQISKINSIKFDASVTATFIFSVRGES